MARGQAASGIRPTKGLPLSLISCRGWPQSSQHSSSKRTMGTALASVRMRSPIRNRAPPGNCAGGYDGADRKGGIEQNPASRHGIPSCAISIEVLRPAVYMNIATYTHSAAGSSVTDAILELKGVVKEYGVGDGSPWQRGAATIKAVSGVSLTVYRGETFGLVGESGCGKSTLAKLIVRLEQPQAGQILFQGNDLGRLAGRSLRRLRRELQLMFQDPYASLDPRMTVSQILSEPLRVQRVGDPASRQARVSELLSEVGISADAIGRFPHEFSGGQRQRIALARALALHPKLIVADEPVSALDVSIRAQILNLMTRLQADHGLTYLIISHDLSVVRYVSDRIGVMYLGKLVEVGPSEVVYAQPAHPYTRGLIAAVPVPNPRAERAKVDDAPPGELPSSINPPSGCRFRSRCPFAQAVCAEVEPPLRAIATGQRAACHFPLEQPA